ncbi:hypothetical protein K458DRAFT_417493 [Lentithecium fluviatile CBS 122367]|uniref:Mid2 domain-containing protein n=1 Tax=Lentithecium fluviatile CBS 122367 TaxID=1168545 RepID=A0A6G1J5N8_9PLEO|nr:hypothetical protein K458DRAFT_417493 [Lentithecium fluviatile CBS 122367]
MNRDGLGPSGAWKTLGCAMSTCCPSGNFYTEEWAWMTSYYSPGVCPSDYQSCAAPTQSGLRLTSKEGERIVFCCPNNCICPNDEDMPLAAPGACGSRLTVSSQLTVYTVMNNFRDQQPDATIPYTFEPGFTQELQIAYPIQIRIPDTGSPVTATAGATGSASVGGSPNSSRKGSSNGGLSTGAIVGIAFGGFFSIFICCLIVYLALRRRRNHREAHATPEARDDRPEMTYVSPAPPYSPLSPSVQRKPLPQQWANTDDARYEMPSNFPNAVLELPARQ